MINIISLQSQRVLENLIATRTSDTTATINWSPPESGPTDLLYSVFQKSSDDRPIEELKNDAATTIQLIDLDPKIEYEIIVVATNPAQNTSLPSYPRSINISMQGKSSHVKQVYNHRFCSIVQSVHNLPPSRT